VPVVDDKNRLIGVIPRVTLLSALGNIPTNTGEIEVVEPHTTVPIDAMTETLRATADSVGSRTATIEKESR
jgi:glycine betaine/proline transport system ATP-binding protein